jgi:hypothetical protein
MEYQYQHLLFFKTACKKACLLLSLLFSCYFINAQNISEFQKGFQLYIQPTTDKIKIDGILDEPVWATTDVAKNFVKKFPNEKTNDEQPPPSWTRSLWCSEMPWQEFAQCS